MKEKILEICDKILSDPNLSRYDLSLEIVSNLKSLFDEYQPVSDKQNPSLEELLAEIKKLEEQVKGISNG